MCAASCYRVVCVVEVCGVFVGVVCGMFVGGVMRLFVVMCFLF